ncbi:C40 family peptidase [Paenibacillus thalictri]|uniref:NlpC/P60 family protein n=1 Tax=Paenibacillus thalictri TaxID=2527873 RepID=A0A4Q9DU00_9BACL|nr:C40 family peptidase [Paenibacillus thalictri]TBL80388.1 NlpC/P60 family protein [Paenibacillus thalictri]
MTNTLNAKKWGKSLIAAGISFTILFSGSMALPQQSAYAYSSSKAQSVISTAKKYTGVKYKYGATLGNTSSFDCSSFTWYVYHKYGVNLPRTSLAQSKVGTYVAKSQLKPGDLVFFYSPVHHVGIYIGGNKMINTYGAGGVRISDLNSATWKKNYKTARRVL